MVKRWNVALIGLMFFAFLMLTGCSLFTAIKSDVSSSPQAQSGAEQSQGALPEARATSSLEAMRRGVASVTPPGSPLKDIHYEYDSYDLSAEALVILKTNANWLQSNLSLQVEIEGHCDERGTNEYNLALGAKRAQNARDYLVTLGISADRLPIISYGEEAPACMEDTEECRQKNRRARFVIITELPSPQGPFSVTTSPPQTP